MNFAFFYFIASHHAAHGTTVQLSHRPISIDDGSAKATTLANATEEGYCNFESAFSVKRPILDLGNINSSLVEAGGVANGHVGVLNCMYSLYFLAVTTLRCSNRCRCVLEFLSIWIGKQEQASKFTSALNPPSPSSF